MILDFSKYSGNKKRISFGKLAKGSAILLSSGLFAAIGFSYYNPHKINEENDKDDDGVGNECSAWNLNTFEDAVVIEENAHLYNVSFGLFNFTDYDKYPYNNVPLNNNRTLGETLGIGFGMHFDDIDDLSDVYFMLLDLRFSCGNGNVKSMTIGKVALDSMYLDNNNDSTKKIAALTINIPGLNNYSKYLSTIMGDRITDRDNDSLYDIVKPLNLTVPFGQNILFTLYGDYVDIGVVGAARDVHAIKDFYVGDWTPLSLASKDNLSALEGLFALNNQKLRTRKFYPDLEEI